MVEKQGSKWQALQGEQEAERPHLVLKHTPQIERDRDRETELHRERDRQRKTDRQK